MKGQYNYSVFALYFNISETAFKICIFISSGLVLTELLLWLKVKVSGKKAKGSSAKCYWGYYTAKNAILT